LILSGQGRGDLMVEMAFLKFASTSLIEAKIARPGRGLLKDAHRHAFNYEPREGYLYVRSRAISSRTNDNFDTFPADEIRKAWATFIGKPVFVNHKNDDIRRKRGVIIDAALHEDIAPDGTPDTWIEVLMEIDAISFPLLAEAIINKDIERTSMGCDVAESECSVCGNVARTPGDYCAHVERMKGQRIRRRSASTGGAEDVLVHEVCRGLSFFENSLLVEPPADPTALFLGVDTRGVTGMVKDASAHIAKPFGDRSPYDPNEETRESFKWRATPGTKILGGKYEVKRIWDNGLVWFVFDVTSGTAYRIGHLAVESRRGRNVVDEIKVDDGYRREGIATALFNVAKSELGSLDHADADELTPDGLAFARHMQGRPIGDERPGAWWNPLRASRLAAKHKPYVRKSAAAIGVKVDEFKDGRTGYMKVRAEIAVPGFDYGSVLPSTIGVEAEEWSTKKWTVRAVFGPYNTRDDRGSYYDSKPLDAFEGTKAEATALVKREVKRVYADFIASGSRRTAGWDAGRTRMDTYNGLSESVSTWSAQDHGGTAEIVKHPIVSAFIWSVEGNDGMVVDGEAPTLEEAQAQAEAALKEHAQIAGQVSMFGARKKVAAEVTPAAEVMCTQGCGRPADGIYADSAPDGFGSAYCSACVNEWQRKGWGVWTKVKSLGSTTKVAFGETTVPPKIDTLRLAECPVCNEEADWDGTGRCRICGYIPPPEPFRDPDLEVAKRVDMTDGWINPELAKAPPFEEPSP